MSRQQPDSSRKLEGAVEGRELPSVQTELPTSTAGQMAEFYAGTDPARTNDGRGDGQWILTAQQCFRTSTDFFDANLRKTVEESMDLYRSRHPAGSKYNLPSFAKRSRLFRPKIRSIMRKKEAQIGKAFFSTNDIVTLTPKNARNPQDILATKVQQELLNYRLKQPGAMNWFMTVVGAFQDASKQGFVVSKTEWKHTTAKQYYSDGSYDERVTADRPDCVVIPCENLRLDPACDWRDPIGSSSYLIELMPMSIREVREMIANPQALYKFREVTDGQLLSGSRQEWDSIRQSREGNRQDRYDQRTGINEFESIWIHKNIVRIEGEDYVYLTIGTEIMLTEPMPLSELDPRGYRGYEYGYTVLEAHNPFPDGEVQLGKPMQEEINETANMGADAVKMATAGRYFTKRGSGIDVEALVRFVPGSNIEVGDIQRDVRWDRSPDAGRGIFEAGNILNQEMSDLMGVFQPNEISGQRKLNETVGGMNILVDNANEISEFTVRTFAETWMEPVLAHVIDLICVWETDETIAAIVGDKLGVQVADVFRMLKTPQNVIVNVGYGSANPESRVRRLQIGIGVAQQVDPMLMQGANKSEILSEVFGALGYPDVARFFPTLGDENAEMKRLQDENTQLRQQVEQGGGDAAKVQIAQLNAETQVRLQEMKQAGAERLLQLKNETLLLIEKSKGELALLDLRIKFEQNAIKKQELYLQREALSHTIQMAEREFALAVQSANVQQANVEADRGLAKEQGDAKAKAGEKPAVPDATPPGVAALIANLRKPASGAVQDSPAVDAAVGAPDLPGDEAGVIARGNYGNIPGAEG